jgi:arginine N-succinyltransferase
MVILRLANLSDVDGVHDLASKAPVGLTTLPYDLEKIQDKVKQAVQSSNDMTDFPNGSSFLFILEEDGEVIGTSALFTKTGGHFPHWTYEIIDFNYYSKSFDKNVQSQFLKLKGVINGPSELGTLFLRKDKRVFTNGKLLSLGRFLFATQHMSSFESSFIAELRGTIIDGESPFWNDIGGKFMNCSLEEADSQVLVNKSFIKEMMPEHPIYINMLSEASQAVIGVADSKTVPAKILLEKEGFEVINEIDIFEAGPILSCKAKDIRTMKNRKYKNFKAISKKYGGEDYLISNTSKDFRACIGKIESHKDATYISKEIATALRLESGDKIIISKVKGV